MLIARAPVRISLAGGGTDLPAYYEPFGGAVLNTTIDKYFYVLLNVTNEDVLQITSSDYRTFYRQDSQEPLLWDGDLRLPRAILHHFRIYRGISMFLASQIPPGTGLGSSSTVTVAIIKAISTALNYKLSKAEIAELACTIELQKLAEPIGKQDQYAAAFGGLNFIEFSSEKVHVESVSLSPELCQELEKRLLLFFTGSSRSASDILQRQTSNSQKRDTDALEALHRVKEMAYTVRQALEAGDLERFGRLLHENWEQKKRFASGITNPFIDKSYSAARQAGAIGGKLTGAGGGGFLMLFCEPPHQAAVTQTMEEMGLKRMDYHFESQGARILMNAGLTIQDQGHDFEL